MLPLSEGVKTITCDSKILIWLGAKVAETKHVLVLSEQFWNCKALLQIVDTWNEVNKPGSLQIKQGWKSTWKKITREVVQTALVNVK